MSKLCVFPFDKENVSIVRYSSLIREYNEVIPVAPNGFFAVGKDVSIIDGGKNCGIVVQGDVMKIIETVDAIFLSELAEYDFDKSVYQEIIKAAIKNDVKIIITDTLCDKLNAKDFADTIVEFSSDVPTLDGHKNLLNIEVPVITVYGLGKNSDKFYTQLLLREFFSKQGYKVSQIGTKKYSDFFGIKPLPKFIFDNIPMADKIKLFNQFAYDLVSSEKSDLLICGVSGGLISTNPFYFEEFGESASIISTALPPDYSVLNVYYQELNNELIDNYVNICKYKLNSSVRAINLTNSCFYMTADDRKGSYFYLPAEKTDEEIKKWSKRKESIFNMHDEKSVNVFVNSMLDELTNKLF